MGNVVVEAFKNIFDTDDRDDSSSLRYFVNEEKRTVVCVFEPSHKAYASSVKSAVKKYNNQEQFIDIDVSSACPVCEGYFTGKYVGKAKCSPDDTWDKEYGKSIARARALIKYQDDKLSYTGYACDCVNNLYERLSENFDKLSKSLESAKTDLNALLKEGHK